MSANGSQADQAIEAGFSAGLVASAIILVALFGVLAPSADTRARLSFLVADAGAVELLGMWLTFGALGCLVLAMARRLSAQALLGVGGGALVGLVMLGSGAAAGAIPSAPEAEPRYWLLGLALAVGAITVSHLRRSGKVQSERRAA